MRNITNKSFYAFYYLVPYALAWWVLSGNQGWAFGIPAIVIATALAWWLGLRPWRVRFQYLPAFTLFFFHQVVAGAWDVALRALKPGPPLDPGWMTYRFGTADSRVRLLCSSLMGLMPGTLTSRIEEDRLWVHALDRRQGWHEAVTRLEFQLNRLVGPDEESRQWG